MSHREIFSSQFTYKAGPGSTRENSASYRDFLERFIQDNAITSILDLGCGDMEIMGNVDLRLRRADGEGFDFVQYVGVDVIEERIQKNNELSRVARHMNFVTADIRSFVKIYYADQDLVIVKDVLQHWSHVEICDFLEHTLGRYKRMLITNCNYGPTVNTNIETGDWRALDLTLPPYEIGSVLLRYGSIETGGIKDVVLVEA
jgi:SAM-dependent methyltransferase